MKILFVIEMIDNHNGTSISAMRYASELRNRGHEVKILTTGEPKADRFVVPNRHLPLVDPIAQRHGFQYAQADENVIREALEWCDVAHCHKKDGRENGEALHGSLSRSTGKRDSHFQYAKCEMDQQHHIQQLQQNILQGIQTDTLSQQLYCRILAEAWLYQQDARHQQRLPHGISLAQMSKAGLVCRQIRGTYGMSTFTGKTPGDHIGGGTAFGLRETNTSNLSWNRLERTKTTQEGRKTDQSPTHRLYVGPRIDGCFRLC